MSQINYRQFYDRVGKRIGWDFSKVKKTEKGKKWDFYEEVVKVAKPTDRLLDIGTGGGERVLKITDKADSIVGIDSSESMVQTANKNLKKSGANNVEFLQMDAFNLGFPDSSFDLVTSRHCDFSPLEVYRVLKKDGYFLTQQVGENDKSNIKKAFRRGQFQNKRVGSMMQDYVSGLKETGFIDIKTADYNSTEYYKTPEDLIFLLKHTPIIPDFGKNKDDFETLEKFIKKNKNRNGIITNSKRFMIMARK
jgi:ubiquinone/menaquinone biosynthesis C-methylase UbiE